MRTPLRIAALAATAAVLAGCTSQGASHRAAPQPGSALSGGARTCTDANGACARSGAVRWVLPLPGTYRVDRSDDPSEVGIRPVVHDEDGDGLSLVASGDTVYLQTGGQLWAVDVATGRVRWRHVSPGTDGYALAMVGGRVVYEEKAPNGTYGPYLSFDPRTGGVLAIPERDGEGRVDEVTSSLVLIHGIGVFSEAAGAGVRQVDPVTGHTRWRARLAEGWEYTVQGGVLYADDYRLRPDLPKALQNRNQTRLIQRVDLRTGRRLPDVHVPRKYWGDYSLDYVTRDGVIVVSTTPAQGDKKRAFTTSGRPVTPVPAFHDDPTAKPTGDQVKVTGRYGRVRYLSGHGWTGPAMRAPGFDTNALVGSRVRVAVAVACAPDGVRAGTLEDPFPATYCTKPRFFGVSW
ncbi:MAG TPA: PQQ-binding-like beta-propeller repeat protein [Streptosporangiales bacterium]